MKEIRTDADGVPVWQERLAWKAEEFFWDFVEALEAYFRSAGELACNPIMATFLGLGAVFFVISAMGTAWWGW